MISAGDFKKGTTFMMDNNICQVIEFQHVKPGKGPAFVRVKYRNLDSGSVIENTFNPNSKYEPVVLEHHNLDYIYEDGNFFYFMDPETFEQTPLDREVFGDQIKFLKEGMTCTIKVAEGRVISAELPTFVVLEVTETEPGVRGDTATNASKNCTVETGAVVKVPLFVNTGDKIRIDTRTGEYMDRAKD